MELRSKNSRSNRERTRTEFRPRPSTAATVTVAACRTQVLADATKADTPKTPPTYVGGVLDFDGLEYDENYMLRTVDYLIIGNGIAGMTAAETIRESDANASIVIVTEEAHPLYSRVLLPNYVNGVIPRARVFLRTEEHYTAKKIELQRGIAATHLDTADRTLHLADRHGFRFKKLLIASGGSPRLLESIPAGIKGVSRFQTIDDADRMLSLLPHVKRGLVVGGSFIALEFLEILFQAHVSTALLFSGSHFFADHIDIQGSKLLEENFRKHGVNPIIPNDSLVGIEGKEAIRAAKTESGREIECDFLGVGIGIQRNIDWLRTSDLQLTGRGILANQFLETSVPGIFTAGDVSDFYDEITRNHHNHGNWSNAFLQGKQAGWNMVHPSEVQPFRNVPFYSITNLGMNIIFVGQTRHEKNVETIVRYIPGDKKYACFSFAFHRLVGAVLINSAVDKPAVTALIGRAVDLGAHQEQFRDPAFALGSLL